MSLSSLLLNENIKEVNLELIIDLAKQGVPKNDPSVRYYLWLLLLRLIPSDKSKWANSIANKLTQYWKWANNFFSAVPDWTEKHFSKKMTLKSFGLEKDEIMTQIHGDLVRTPKESFEKYEIAENSDEVNFHTRRIERILYVFSCLNSAYSYTQGFNELCLPIYHVVLMAHKKEGRTHDDTEAISFFMLQNLITGTGLGDLFTMEHDFEAVSQRFSMIKEMSRIADQELYKQLFVLQEIDPLHFAFSWVSVLFGQIYCGEKLLLLWDRFLLRTNHILDYGMAMATAHIIEIKVSLTGKSFTEIVETLHKIEEQDPGTITSRAEDIWAQYIQSIDI